MQSWPAAVRDHEVHGRRRRPLGGADEVPLVFAVLGIDDNNHLAATNRVDGLFDGGKMAGHVIWRGL